MTDLVQLLDAIRFGDRAFPSGGFAFSSGLEGSHRDGLVKDEGDVTTFSAEQLVAPSPS
ncbi:MAG: urease accessory protein [Mycobacterium sp.]|nr:urease accessory protein [Mycobacterium sp.]